jgi:hypothetical protein|nr:MAG TPA: hypothetical protein [Caudoviricetes sp.]
MELSNDKSYLSEQIMQLLKKLDYPQLVRIGDLSIVTELDKRDCYGDVLSEIDASIFVHETFVFDIYTEYGQVFYYSGTHVYNNIQVLQAVVEELQKRTQED